MMPSDFILPLIAVVWASGNVFMTMMKELNDKRDRILLGRNGDRSMSTEHRRLLLMNDWVPLSIIAVLFTLAVGVMTLIMPFQMEMQDRSVALWLICGCVAFMSACCSFAFGFFGVSDYRMLRKYLDTDTDTVKPESTHAEPGAAADGGA